MKWIGVKYYLMGFVLSFQTATFAQGYVENALQFSTTWSGGSARILGAGGAQVSLGGDFSSALSNPAGLGMYNRSEFTISPSVNVYKSTGTYFGNEESDSKSVFNIPGLSYVHHMSNNRNGFLGGSFAISLTRTNDFHNIIRYSGENPNSSILDFFVEQANGDTEDQFWEGNYNYNSLPGLAYNNYLIGPQDILDPPGPSNQYFTDVLTIPYQGEEISTRGASNQWSISYGANYNDVLFIGGGIGITTLRYESVKSYYEEFTADVVSDIELIETLDVDGSGFNATFGLIGRPADFLQIGASIVTPTWYKLTSNYYAEMYSSWNNFDYYGDGSLFLNDEFATLDEGGLINDYSFATPFKFSAGATFISKYGFISADLEMLNPAKSRYDSDVTGISFSPENDVIRSSYAPVKNLRIGGEFRHDIMRFRLGYGHYGNPYQNENIEYTNWYWSTGAGLRTKTFYADLAYVSRTTSSYYFPYIFQDGYADPVDVKSKVHSFVLTCGFTF